MTFLWTMSLIDTFISVCSHTLNLEHPTRFFARSPETSRPFKGQHLALLIDKTPSPTASYTVSNSKQQADCGCRVAWNLESLLASLRLYLSLLQKRDDSRCRDNDTRGKTDYRGGRGGQALGWWILRDSPPPASSEHSSQVLFFVVFTGYEGHRK
jgi:hypothetical protein